MSDDRKPRTMRVWELLEALREQPPEDFVYLHQQGVVVGVQRQLCHAVGTATPCVVIKGPND